MAVIKCNNPNFNDSRCNVLFKNGVAETDKAEAIEWFKRNGYVVLINDKTKKAKKDA